METVIELKPFGQFWQITCDGSVVVYAATRESAICGTAASLRPQLHDPVAIANLRFVGFELTELLAAPSLDPNWKRKGPKIDLALFGQAESYLATEFIPEDEAAVLDEYRQALTEWDFDRALECLVQLGEWQDCKNPYWRVLEQLIPAVWPTEYMVDRREKGELETWIEHIQQRARGRVQ